MLHRIVAFSVDIRSLGSPWLFQVAISASSVNRDKGSRPEVIGIGTYYNVKIKMDCQDRKGTAYVQE